MSSTPGTAQQRTENVEILVLGDVNWDTLLAPLPGGMDWWRVRGPGGAWLLREMIAEALRGINQEACNVDKALLKRGKCEAEVWPAVGGDKDFLNTEAILGLFPKAATGGPGDTEKVYRLERLIGRVHDKDKKDPVVRKENHVYKKALEDCLAVLPDRTQARRRDIIVLHDQARDFRDLDKGKLTDLVDWHYKERETWIVWQMYSPVAKGELWAAIAGQQDWLERTIVVVKSDAMREAGANIPDNTSLEKECEMVQESVNNAGPGSQLRMLASAGHLVVDFHRQGVLHWAGAGARRPLETSCYYCPNISEQPSARGLGTMVGYTSILVAAIVRGIAWKMMCDPAHLPNGIIEGVRQAVVLDHLHYLHGYADGTGDQDILKPGAADPKPYERLFNNLTTLAGLKWKEGGRDYRIAALPLRDAREESELSRITGLIGRRVAKTAAANRPKRDKAARAQRAEHAERLMHDIVVRGLEKVVDEDMDSTDVNPMPSTPGPTLRCPFEMHGALKTAYRHEIDSLASMRRIIEKYLHNKDWQSPLSIAVFGEPGSGKSFTIQQLLESISPKIAARFHLYNVAQFVDTKDLETAFRKLQDEAVTGEVPLAFFDEFDASFGDEECGWLKYFLAPMQDGKFKAGESTYRIGRAIFVFAGGVSKSWADFYENRKRSKTFGKFKDAKGPDFVSRLRGHLDIMTINCPGRKRKVDHVLMFRRAVLLRSLLKHRLKEIFDSNTDVARIDTKVISAFLKVPRYEHETRSMQAIIEMSRASDGGHFLISSLPAREQLNMHVNADSFYQFIAKAT